MLVAHEHKSTGAHDEEEQAQPQTGVEDHSAHRVPQMLHRGILFHRIIPNYRLFRFDRAAKRVDRRRYRTCQGEGHESADRHVGPLNHRIQAEAHSIDQGSGHSERLGNARRPAGHGSEPQRQGRHEPCDA